MKLKKLLAAVTAAALAVTTMAVTSFTASAAAFTPYILLNVNSNDWGINGAWVAADKTEITASQTEYEFSYTAGKDDTWDGDQSKIEAYFYSPMDNLKNASIKSVSINGTDKNISQSAGSYNQYLWDNIENGNVPGYSAVVNPDAVKALGTVTNGDVIKIVLSVTLDESLKSIGAANFTCSKTAGELETGDSFTITYDSTNTPDTAKWVVKCAFDEDFADAGITNRWPQLVNSDGTVDNSASADTGLEVAKTAEGVYTFTAVNASKAGYVINVEASAAGDFNDTQYLGQGGGKWSVAAAAEPAMTISPTTLTVAEGEDAVITITATNADDYIYEAESSDDAKATATVNGTTVTVTGIAAGTATITVTGTKTGARDITATCAVTVTDGTTPPAIDTSGWQAAFNGFTGNWGGWQGSASEKGTLTHTCTVKDVMDANGMTSIDELGGILAQVWNASVGDRVAYAIRIESADGTIKDVRSGIYTVAEGNDGGADGTFKQYQTAATDGDFVFAPTDVLKIAIAAGETVPTIPDDEPDDPTPPVTGSAIWEGTQDLGNWADTPVEIAAEKFTSINAKDTIKFTYTINAVPGEAWNQIKIADSNDTVLASPTGQNEWNCIDLSSTTTYSFEISAADLALVKANGMKITGHGVVLKKVECVAAGGDTPVPPEHTHTPATAWSSDATGHWHACSGCDEKLSFAAHTSDTGTVTTPATETTSGTRIYKCTVCEYVIRTETIPATGSSSVYPPAYTVGAPIIPVGSNGSNAPTVNGQSGWEAVSAEIVTSSDGGKIVVNMNSATKVPSTILGDIEGKDVDLVLNMGRGITWTINGLSVTSRKTIDLDISKNTRHIPDEVVDKAEGSHKKQFSLDHKGNFGCTAALTYDVGTRYNGLYANLFYYNPKTEQLEFADCSLISGGNAKFMFTHASDYLITISDEPLGEFEDVSSAAGIVSDNGVIGNGAAISAVLAVIVLGFGIVVYRKRRHN